MCPKVEKRHKIIMLALGGFLFATSAYALPVNYEFEDWGTNLGTDPLTCPSSGCVAPTEKDNITPTGQVNRKATIIQQSGINPVFAQTLSLGCATSPTEGCLNFSQGDGSLGSLILDWQFNTTESLDNVGIKALTNSNPFDVAVFYYDGTSFLFADAYTVSSSLPHTFVFDFPPGTTTDEIIAVYNPLHAMALDGYIPIDPTRSTGGANGPVIDPFNGPQELSIEAELCCLMSNFRVPEPPTLPLMGIALAALAFAGRRLSSKPRYSRAK